MKNLKYLVAVSALSCAAPVVSAASTIPAIEDLQCRSINDSDALKQRIIGWAEGFLTATIYHPSCGIQTKRPDNFRDDVWNHIVSECQMRPRGVAPIIIQYIGTLPTAPREKGSDLGAPVCDTPKQ